MSGSRSSSARRPAVNRPGESGDLLVLELSGRLGSLLSVVGHLEFDGWDVAAVLERAAVVEPVDVLGGGVLDVVDGAPRAAALDQFGLVQAVDRLGQSVVIRVAGGADRGGDADFGETLGVPNGCVLRPTIGMCHDGIHARPGTVPGPHGLLEGV